MIPLLSDLRGPPVVGRTYMVPFVYHPWHGRDEDWPVIGPKHADEEFFNFSYHHYHVDIRFLGSRLTAFALRQMRWQRTDDVVADLAFVATGYPLVSLNASLPKGRPALKPMRCVRPHYQSSIDRNKAGAAAIAKMQAHYGSPAEPIRLADGRMLCPHQKVDLSQFVPDADGVVTCPIHGLKVRCGWRLL